MKPEDFDEFAEVLDHTYDLIGASQAAKLISAPAKQMFFNDLIRYPLDWVLAGLAAHRADGVRGKYTPKPADVIFQIDQYRKRDGRPDDDEAWAIAIVSRDESATVVWTQEIAAAFASCQPVLTTGDEIGARMAFKSAYRRMVDKARADRIPVKWSASLGWDMRQRESALNTAASAGLLSGPVIAALLPPPTVSEVEQDDGARANIQRIKTMLAALNEEKEREREEYAQRMRAETAEAKRRQADLAANYQGDA